MKRSRIHHIANIPKRAIPAARNIPAPSRTPDTAPELLFEEPDEEPDGDPEDEFFPELELVVLPVGVEPPADEVPDDEADPRAEGSLEIVAHVPPNLMIR